MLGAISGAVAGLVAITPAAGFVLPGPALLIGVAAGVDLLLVRRPTLKRRLGYDDSLDALACTASAACSGCWLTGLFAYGPLTATPEAAPEGLAAGGFGLLGVQALGVAGTIAWSGGVTWG